MDDQFIIQACLVAYLVIMAGVGIASRRLIKTSDDFFRAGNNMPWWIAGASLYMGSFSAFAFVAFGSVAFNHGVMGALVGLGGVIGWFLAAFLLAHRWRRTDVTTPTEFLEKRFGAKIRQGIVWLNLFISPIQSGLRLFAFSLIVHGILDYPIIDIILLTALIMFAYSSLGGLWAVALTDTIQFVIIMVGVAPLVVLSINAAGGAEGVIELSKEGFFSPERSKLTFWWLTTWWVSEIINTLASFQGVQRYNAVASEGEARKAAMLAGALLIPTTFIILTPPLLAAHLFPEIDGQLAFATMTNALLPTGLVGLMLGAMCAATMSSLDSIFNVDASLMTHDVYKRVIAPKASAQRLVLVGRISTLIAISAATAVAVLFASLNLQTFDILEIFQSRFMIIIWVFFVLGITTKKASNRSFAAALGASFLFSAVLLAIQIPTQDSRFLVALFSIGSFVLFGWLLPPQKEAKTAIDQFFEQLKTPLRHEAPIAHEQAGASASVRRILSYGLLSFAIIPGAIALLRLVRNDLSLDFLFEAVIFLILLLIGWALRPR